MWKINEYIWTNTHPRNHKGISGKTLCILYKIEENILLILHIYGARAIFLPFCDHQETKLESCEIKKDHTSTNIHQKIIYQRINKTTLLLLYKRGATYCGCYSYLWSFSHVPNMLWSLRHWIWVMRCGNRCSLTNVNTETNMRGHMG